MTPEQQMAHQLEMARQIAATQQNVAHQNAHKAVNGQPAVAMAHLSPAEAQLLNATQNPIMGSRDLPQHERTVFGVDVGVATSQVQPVYGHSDPRQGLNRSVGNVTTVQSPYGRTQVFT